MDAPGPDAPVSTPAGEPVRPRPMGLRSFLRGPKLADRRGFGFVVLIFVLVVVVFGVAYYAFVTSLSPIPTAPVRFDAAYMVHLNGTFNVSADSGTTWASSGFTVNLSINNVGGIAVPLAASGQNASILVGTSARKDTYHIVWIDRDGNDAVSVGDTFWVTGYGVGLPALSYVQVSLTWRATGWTATEYFVTSSAIV